MRLIRIRYKNIWELSISKDRERERERESVRERERKGESWREIKWDILKHKNFTRDDFMAEQAGGQDFRGPL